MSQSRCSDTPATSPLPFSVRLLDGLVVQIMDADGKIVATMEGSGPEPTAQELNDARELVAARNCRDELIAVVEREAEICAVLPHLRGRAERLRQMVRRARGEGS